MGWLIGCQLVSGHGIADAGIPRTIHYQGRLTELSGAPLTGEHTVAIRLYDAPTGGTELWKEQHTVAMAREDEGIVSIELGSRTPFPSQVTFNSPLWLTIEIDGTGEFSPRQALSAAGYAMNADALDGLDSPQLLRADIDTIAKGQLKATKSGAALVVQPSSDPAADTKLIDVQNAAGASKFSVDLEGDAAVAGNLTVSGSIAGSSSITGTANPSWAIGSGTDASAANLSLLFGQASGQESLVFQGAGSDDFVLSDDLRLDGQSALRFVEAAANGTDYVALQAPSSIAGNVTWTLPGADGSASQVLSTDGAGTLSWASAGSIGGVGDITDVTAGAGLTGGGASGAVTLSVGAGTGLIANPDDVAIDPVLVPRLTAANAFTAANTFNPGAVDLTPLTIRQTSAGSPAARVLSVTSAGLSPYLTVASSGNVGVGTDSPGTNRLVVAHDQAAPSSALFTNNNAGGRFNVTINKGAVGNTASVIFQDAFSGRAEVGLTGDDKLHVKVSPNGATWQDALVIDQTNARVGVGATDPGERLEVLGNIKVTGAGNRIIFPDGTTQKTAPWNRITSFESSSQAISNSSDTLLLSATITKSEASSVLLILATVQLIRNGSNRTVDVKLFRDVVTQLDATYEARVGNDGGGSRELPVGIHVIDTTAGAGLHTVALRAQASGGGVSATVRRLTVIELFSGT